MLGCHGRTNVRCNVTSSHRCQSRWRTPLLQESWCSRRLRNPAHCGGESKRRYWKGAWAMWVVGRRKGQESGSRAGGEAAHRRSRSPQRVRRPWATHGPAHGTALSLPRRPLQPNPVRLDRPLPQPRSPLLVVVHVAMVVRRCHTAALPIWRQSRRPAGAGPSGPRRDTSPWLSLGRSRCWFARFRRAKRAGGDRHAQNTWNPVFPVSTRSNVPFRGPKLPSSRGLAGKTTG